MDKIKNSLELDGNLPDFELGKIRDETGSYIFENFSRDEDKLQEFVNKFDDIYYLSAYPQEIEKHKDNPTIYDILKRYQHTAEGHKLELMIFKLKEISEEKKLEALNRIKAMYPGLDIKLDETKYDYIVGYFGGTAGRTNSYYMEQIKTIYPVKTL